MRTLPCLTLDERRELKVLLSTKVVTMMGRKLEEGDWSEVYCRAKGIPEGGWSNLTIDVNHRGLGIEFKMLRVKPKAGGDSILSFCGRTIMHPAATRSIRIGDVYADPESVKVDVLLQYRQLIDAHMNRVRDGSPDGSVDVRFGWLLWERKLREFLYFEERMCKPDPDAYYAEWHETPPRGSRKPSRSLWIYRRESGKKRYSVTTTAGIKLQPYFDVPTAADPNLVYVRVQSEALSEDVVQLWISATTADRLRRTLGSLGSRVVSEAIVDASRFVSEIDRLDVREGRLAVPVRISRQAHDLLEQDWCPISDEHAIQHLLRVLALRREERWI